MSDKTLQIELRRKRLAVMTMVLLSSFSMPMMLSAVNVALPSIAESLSLDAVMLAWVPMAYLMASAALVLSFGRLADLVGRKKIFNFGILGLILSSILAATANDGWVLIGYRLIQGMTAAMLYATHIAIVSSVYPPSERGRMIGLSVSIIYVGLTCGPLVGGWLTGLYGWRSTFLIHVPLCTLSWLMGWLYVKEEWKADNPGDFDIVGAALYSGAIIALMLGISGLPDSTGGMLIVVGLLGFYGFFRHQHGRDHPLIDVSLFYTNKVFTYSCIASIIMYTATFANIVLLSLYLQYLLGLTPSKAGLVLMAQPVIMALVAPLSGRLSDHKEPGVLASFGMTLTAIGLALLATLDVDSEIHTVVVYLCITGFGFSFFSSPNANAIMGSVDKHQNGAAGGAVATVRILGQMTSMAVVSMVFTLILGPVQITSDTYDDLASAIQISFIAFALMCVVGVYFSYSRGRVH
ncbi:MAG: MFS transporter [Gammaproteobacteria bacterium]